jgi:hypothetical protein
LQLEEIGVIGGTTLNSNIHNNPIIRYLSSPNKVSTDTRAGILMALGAADALVPFAKNCV